MKDWRKSWNDIFVWLDKLGLKISLERMFQIVFRFEKFKTGVFWALFGMALTLLWGVS